jgi:hypothetical protein
MIHHDLLHTIKEEKQRGGFIYPYYGRYSIAEVPHTVLSAFGIESGRARLPIELPVTSPKHVLCFFVDGFGFDHLLAYRNEVPFLARLAEKADVFPITSVFPSTTPAALTAIHTGLTPQEHGLPEWTVYFEEFDRIIETFPFRAHLTHGRETLLEIGGTPEMLYEGPTIYEALQDAGVRPYVLTSEDYAESAYSRMVQRGANVVPIRDSDHLFDEIERLLALDEPSYIFAYWSEVDSVEHVFGPGTPEHRDALQRLSTHLEERLVPLTSRDDASETLFLLTSDHGQSPIANEDIIYLNDYLPLEENYYRPTPGGKGIRPTGAPHDVFLFIHREKLTETVEYLCRELKDKAAVLSIDDAISRGLFGLNDSSARFRRRIGDILILPYEGYHVWYRHLPDAHFGQRGIHGGLSEREMIVPFATAKLSDLS